MNLKECKVCNGTMKFRDGQYGFFFGCSNYPKCKNTFSFEYIVKIICNNGIEFYCGDRECWKCHKITKVYAYFLNKQLAKIFYENELMQIGYLEGPESILKIDEWMIKKIKNIKIKYSKTEWRSYTANVCERCDALQGNWFLFQEPYLPFWDIKNQEPTFTQKIIF